MQSHVYNPDLVETLTSFNWCRTTGVASCIQDVSDASLAKVRLIHGSITVNDATSKRVQSSHTHTHTHTMAIEEKKKLKYQKMLTLIL